MKEIYWEKWKNPIIKSEKDDDDEVETKSVNNVVVSPLGIIPIGEHNDISKSFNLWVMHTNFNISQTVIDLLDATDGVETLFKGFTRYRCLISFGKCFNDEDVKSNIEKALGATNEK